MHGKQHGQVHAQAYNRGIKTFLLGNLVLLAVPAVIISTLIGALNGYVLSQWKFKELT
ncbi:MAG: hypothetical protein CM15mP117_12770 [Alphaproteobacteria bacterium]|nr:MAG: hypothetical protein CM15mP117_12770 [Alphaproteobacteria bacterium]